jgi:hypothetical protein
MRGQISPLRVEGIRDHRLQSIIEQTEKRPQGPKLIAGSEAEETEVIDPVYLERGLPLTVHGKAPRLTQSVRERRGHETAFDQVGRFERGQPFQLVDLPPMPPRATLKGVDDFRPQLL